MTFSPISTRALCAMMPGLCSVGCRLTSSASPVLRWRHALARDRRAHRGCLDVASARAAARSAAAPPLPGPLLSAPKLRSLPALPEVGVASPPSLAPSLPACSAAVRVGMPSASALASSRFAITSRCCCVWRARSIEAVGVLHHGGAGGPTGR